MFIADRNIITFRNQKPNKGGVCALSAQKLRRIMTCSLSSDELLPLIRDSASALRYQHAEARAREGYLAVSTRKGCIRSTAYWIRKSLCYFVLPLVFDRVRDVSNRSI